MKRHARVFAVAIAYAVVAVAFAWPIPANPGAQLPTPADGDTAVYVWNVWVFHHEIATHGRWPLATSHVLSPVPSVSLILHNYTIFTDLLAFALVPMIGVVGAFNVGNLLLPAMAACTMFLLAFHLTRSAPAAWLAGLAFGFSPYMSARGLGHYSLVGSAPLPLVAWGVVRALETGRWQYASVAGAGVAWAFTMDPYYAIYGVVIACVLTFFTVWQLSPAPASRVRTVVGRGGAALALAFVALSIAVIITGGWDVPLAGVLVRIHGLYTPVLVAAVGAWAWISARYVVRRTSESAVSAVPLTRLSAAAAATCAILLAPVVPGVVRLLAQGGSLAPAIFWRSGPPGIDALSLLAPNPLNAWFGNASRKWLATLPNGVVENTASVPWVLLGVVAFAAFRGQLNPPRRWVALAAIAAVLALGPFVHIAGVNTYIPGPWILARYVPVLGAARMPGRFAIVVMLALALLFACGAAYLLRMSRRPALTTVVLTALLLAELAPLPRPVFSTRVPEIYQQMRLPGEEQAVLELPVGLMDGLVSAGAFSPTAQFFQTQHANPIVGGYISRLPPDAVALYRSDPVLRALLALSERRELTAAEERDAIEAAASGKTSVRVGFVVVETARASPQLREFAIRALRLKKVAESEGRELFRPLTASR